MNWLLVLFLTSGVAQAVTLSVGMQGDADYPTIQSAIDALPAEGGEILVAAGKYREKVVIEKNNVTLAGTGAAPQDTLLVYGDSAASVGSTFKSYTMLVSGDDFHARNLTVQNDYWLDNVNAPSQAVALNITGDRAVLEHVRLLGHQDTLYANKGAGGRMARQFFSDCYVEGHVDFIFGNAKAYFQRCHLHAKSHHEVMYTAQSRNAADEDSGYVFNHCVLTADADARNVFLGRPWRAFSTVVFLHADIQAAVAAAGWREWRAGGTQLDSAFYAEYRSTGSGANPLHRHPQSHQLSDQQAKAWTLGEFFHHDIDWIEERLR